MDSKHWSQSCMGCPRHDDSKSEVMYCKFCWYHEAHMWGRLAKMRNIALNLAIDEMLRREDGPQCPALNFRKAHFEELCSGECKQCWSEYFILRAQGVRV